MRPSILHARWTVAPALLAACAGGCTAILGTFDFNGPAANSGGGGSGGSGTSTGGAMTTSTTSGMGGADPCSNMKRDGDETGTDCGGGTCAACPVGEGCVVGTDCESLACGAGHVCVAAKCDDLVKNGDETDTDCGGSCPACAPGGHCAIDADCTPHVCSGGQCATACTPGETRCAGLDAQTCDADGVWQTTETCMFVCDAGSCTGVCSPGAKQCSGLDAQTCDATGQWQTTETCPYLCDAGDCTGMCTPGTKQCSGLVPQTCDASGQWQGGTACPYLCSAGDCTGCAPGSKQCAGSTPQTCDASKQWQSGTPCSGTTPFCAAGMCSTSPPSCQAGATGAGVNCGPSSNESCCTSLLVTGGTFYRGYDGVTYTDKGYPATVSSFKLDKFEVTVGRFRQFVNAWLGGWRPDAGAGKHSHINGGSGLADSGNPGAYETGWDPAWAANLATTASDWNTNLAGNGNYPTWTPSAGSNEKRPINWVSWYEAYAFCIWDGGFLPSEAEWNYAAAGGNQQRVYPWSSPATSTAIDCTYANYYYNNTTACYSGPNNVGSESQKGNGRYGQADLAGNVGEWTLDWFASYLVPCSDCANLTSAQNRAIRGGSFEYYEPIATASYRQGHPPTFHVPETGFRCARSP